MLAPVEQDLFVVLLQRLRRLRQKRELTQEAFAEKAQVSYKYYQAIEGGRKRDLRLSTLAKLAAAHGISLSELLDFPRPVMTARVADKATQYRFKKNGPKPK
ncbi:MAG: helix-turn-helix transcriptional regulator [Methylacidiphilales bacterium]|nr:helix-turn-helix transcriptional regulator [Candidatus Methylacidiphilales bacterium]